MPHLWPFRKPLIGLDIGSSSIKLVALARARGGWRLVAAAEAPTPDGSVREGLCTDPVAVADALRQVIFKKRPHHQRVAVALSGHAVIVKRLSLPAMSDDQLAEAMSWEAEQYVPFDLAEVQLDYQVLSKRTEASSAMDVLLVAAKRDRIEDRTLVVAQAGCEAVVMDVEAFALANAYALNYPERQEPFVALVHVGHRSTVICLLERGYPAFTRDLPIGGQAYSDALMRVLNVDGATADHLRAGGGARESGQEAARAVVREVTSDLVAEVKKAVDFYRSDAPVEQLSRVVLSGGAREAEGLVELIGAAFTAPVDTFEPFRRISQSKQHPAQTGSSFAVAVGLALRQERAA